MTTLEKITNLLLLHSGSMENFTEMKGLIDELLQSLIDLMTCEALKGTPINDSKYSRLIEKITGKPWEDSKCI